MGLNRGCCEEALLLRCSIVMEAKDADVLTNGSKRSRRKSVRATVEAVCLEMSVGSSAARRKRVDC
jgi:hypothetical protein